MTFQSAQFPSLRSLLHELGRSLRRIRSLLSRRGRTAARRQRSWLAVETLETRELLSTAIGMNLERVSDYMAAPMFTDAMKQSRPWVSGVYNTATRTFSQDTTGVFPINLDDKGWPTQLNQTRNAQGQLQVQLLETMMFIGQNGHYPAGTYHAQWQGTGTVQWDGDLRVVQQGLTSEGIHFAELSVTPGNQGIHFRINTMSTTDPIRNLHVWLPDYNGQSFVGQVWSPGASFSPFYPQFLQRLSPFHTLRFMQDAVTNTSQVQHWSDLKPVDYQTQMSSALTFQNGMNPQYMIELSNELNADLWVNIPHMADDDFIRTYANLVRDSLKPGLKAYVEWSNEVWNGAPGFMGNQWVRQQLTLPQNAGVSPTQFIARQFGHTFDIWTQAFAGQTDRLVRVAAGFEPNPWYTNQILQNLQGNFDAVSTAAYFGPTPPMLATYTANTTVDQVLNDTVASIPTWLGFLRTTKAMADQYSAALHRHISYAAYEGGPALEGHYQPYQTVLNQASVSPRMYDIYRQFLIGANQVGLDLLVNFEFTDRNMVNSPYGLYGSLHYLDQPLSDAPKYRVLLEAATGSLFGAAPSQTSGAAATVQPAGTTTPPAPVANTSAARDSLFAALAGNDVIRCLEQDSVCSQLGTSRRTTALSTAGSL